MVPSEPTVNAARRRANLRLALVLAALAVAVFVGFIVKSALFGA